MRERAKQIRAVEATRALGGLGRGRQRVGEGKERGRWAGECWAKLGRQNRLRREVGPRMEGR